MANSCPFTAISTFIVPFAVISAICDESSMPVIEIKSSTSTGKLACEMLNSSPETA